MVSSTLLFLLLAAVGVQAVSNWPILAPEAGEVVPTNEPYTIEWTNQTEGPVSITLMYLDTNEIILTSSTNNTGFFEWTPASVLATNADYFLKICDLTLDSSECSYTSDGRFHIVSLSATSTTSTTTPLSATTTVSTSTAPTTTSTSTTTLTMNTPTPAEDNDNRSSGLGTASVVGLSVGTTLGTLTLTAVAFIFYKKSRKRKAAKQASAPGYGPGPNDVGYLPQQQQHDQQYMAQGYPVPQQKHYSQMQQMQHHPSELDSRGAVHEMGDHRR